jgi:hypothetical protein
MIRLDETEKHERETEIKLYTFEEIGKIYRTLLPRKTQSIAGTTP